ncbi:hypothetical protein MANES_08G000601v8 [Manihot esculenta]|uniref:SCP domain-containing protein n=1 Tax=Manihot esculenta TaxID=3983 RepID=A0A2C9VC39_MANES|nr:hypothetical protein MANES_08G000601v8 [Manihot esculenta]
MSPIRFLFNILISSLFILSVSSTFPLLPFHHHLPDELHPAVQVKRAIMAHQFLIAHNCVRAAYGLSPLRWNRTLMHSPDSPYGENMFWSKKSHWGPTEVVKCWADEKVYYNQKTNECINGEKCDHFTQLVWKDTERVGCGRVRCNNDKGFLYVCSYDPPGNYYFEGPFGGTFTKSIAYPPPGSV